MCVAAPCEHDDDASANQDRPSKPADADQVKHDVHLRSFLQGADLPSKTPRSALEWWKGPNLPSATLLEGAANSLPQYRAGDGLCVTPVSQQGANPRSHC